MTNDEYVKILENALQKLKTSTKKPKFTNWRPKTYENKGHFLFWGRNLTDEQMTALKNGEIFTLLDIRLNPCKEVFMDAFNQIEEARFTPRMSWLKRKIGKIGHRWAFLSSNNNWLQRLIKTIRLTLGLKTHWSGEYWDFPRFSQWDKSSQGQGMNTKC